MTTMYNAIRGNVVRRLALVGLVVGLVALTGCPPPKGLSTEVPPPPLRPVAEQVAAVNRNVAGITRTLSGGGINVSSKIQDEGKTHRYDLDGKIRFLPPRFLYFDLSHLGVPSAVHIGSNDEQFWVWVKPEQNKLWYGRWADLHPADTKHMPLAPDMILSAMGLAPLPTAGSGLVGPMPRVDDHRYYKLLYSAGGENGLWIQREYWLDRYPPFLPRVVVFREPDGQVQMQATLDDYQSVEGSPVYVARDVRMIWPKEDDSLRIRFGKLKFDEKTTADSPAFISPDKNSRRVPVPRSRWIAVTEEGVDEDEPAAATEPIAGEDGAPGAQVAGGTRPARPEESPPE